jgi:hypothetical protein
MIKSHAHKNHTKLSLLLSLYLQSYRSSSVYQLFLLLFIEQKIYAQSPFSYFPFYSELALKQAYF